jgi:hypothetical protein
LFSFLLLNVSLQITHDILGNSLAKLTERGSLGESSYNLRAKGICLLWAEYTEAQQIVCVTVSHVRNTDIYYVGRISLRRPCSGSEAENTTWRTN